jgi:hypothetical protein
MFHVHNVKVERVFIGLHEDFGWLNSCLVFCFLPAESLMICGTELNISSTRAKHNRSAS